MVNAKQTQKVIQGGYSDIRLWPCYMLISSLILFLTPQIGAFWGTLVVLVPFILIAKWVADRQPRDVFDHETWKRDLDLFIEKGHAFPDTANYWSVEYRKPRVKVEKVKQQKLAGVMPATAKT